MHAKLSKARAWPACHGCTLMRRWLIQQGACTTAISLLGCRKHSPPAGGEKASSRSRLFHGLFFSYPRADSFHKRPLCLFKVLQLSYSAV